MEKMNIDIVAHDKLEKEYVDSIYYNNFIYVVCNIDILVTSIISQLEYQIALKKARNLIDKVPQATYNICNIGYPIPPRYLSYLKKIVQTKLEEYEFEDYKTNLEIKPLEYLSPHDIPIKSISTGSIYKKINTYQVVVKTKSLEKIKKK